MKRLICAILVLTLCLSCGPFSAYANESVLKVAVTDVFSHEFGYEKCKVYIYEDDCYMNIEDIARYTRSVCTTNGETLMLTHGSREITMDLSSNTLYEDGIVASVKTVQKGELILIHAFPLLSYLGAKCEVKDELLTIVMPQYTVWEGLKHTGYENQYTLDTFGSLANRKFILLFNGILKVLEGGLVEALCDNGKKEALVHAMQIDPLQYDGAWELKADQDAQKSSLMSSIVAAHDFAAESTEVPEHVLDFMDNFGFDYLEMTSKDETDFLAKLESVNNLSDMLSKSLSFLSNVSENSKCTDGSMDMLIAFKKHAPYDSEFLWLTDDVILKAAGEVGATLDATKEVAKELIIEKVLDDEVYEQLPLGKTGYFSTLKMVEASINISVLLNKVLFGEERFEFAEAQTSAINLMYLKNELADTSTALGNQIRSDHYSNVEDIEDYRLLKVFYYKVLIATYEQFKQMIIAEYGEDNPQIADELVSLDEAMNAFAKQLHVLTVATGAAFPNVETISASNVWDDCSALKDKATEITETDDLAMYYLSVQGGQYAISGEYKYYTIQSGFDEMEPLGHLYKENIQTGERTLLKKDTLAQCINVVGDKVFYTLYGSGPYDCGVHMISTDGTGYKTLSDKMICALVADDTYVYFAENPYCIDSAGIYRIAYDSPETTAEVVVPDISGYVHDLNLLPGKVVYSAEKTAVNIDQQIIIYDLSTKSQSVINNGNEILELFEEMWVHGDYIYILKWKGYSSGEGSKAELSEVMKRDLYRYNHKNGQYEVCELPLADYEAEPFMRFYWGDIYSGILDDFEKELPTDFESSAEYTFVSVS